MLTCGSLLCGNPSVDGIAKSALAQLQSSIDRFSGKAVQFLTEEASEDTLSFGPFCARVLLENACAALTGRLDPFRLLYLSEFQSQGGFEYGKPAKSGFRWSVDVMPGENPLRNMWSVEHELPKISRALFSQYLDHVYWKPAVEKALDHIANRNYDEAALTDILGSDENFISRTKGRCIQLYAALSKGVHWEFFTSTLVLDESTVKSAIRDTCLIISSIGLISHFVPTAFASLPPEEAIEAYISFRRSVP